MPKDEADRLAADAARTAGGIAAGGDAGGYHVSSATAEPLRRKLRGRWSVKEHTVGEEPFLARFGSRLARGFDLEMPEYRADYEFKDGLCLKRVEIVGVARNEEGEADYRYRMNLALSWDLEAPGRLAIRPELGYQCTEIGGEGAVVKDLDDARDAAGPVSVAFRFEGDSLVLEEGEDRKVLSRRP